MKSQQPASSQNGVCWETERQAAGVLGKELGVILVKFTPDIEISFSLFETQFSLYKSGHEHNQLTGLLSTFWGRWA